MEILQSTNAKPALYTGDGFIKEIVCCKSFEFTIRKQEINNNQLHKKQVNTNLKLLIKKILIEVKHQYQIVKFVFM